MLHAPVCKSCTLSCPCRTHCVGQFGSIEVDDLVNSSWLLGSFVRPHGRACGWAATFLGAITCMWLLMHAIVLGAWFLSVQLGETQAGADSALA
jgi:hypothetical protein